MNDLKEIVLRLDGNHFSGHGNVHYCVSESKYEDGHWTLKVHVARIAESEGAQDESNE